MSRRRASISRPSRSGSKDRWRPSTSEVDRLLDGRELELSRAADRAHVAGRRNGEGRRMARNKNQALHVRGGNESIHYVRIELFARVPLQLGDRFFDRQLDAAI